MCVFEVGAIQRAGNCTHIVDKIVRGIQLLSMKYLFVSHINAELD